MKTARSTGKNFLCPFFFCACVNNSPYAGKILFTAERADAKGDLKKISACDAQHQ
jgi:hypothetical protein